MLKKLSGKRMGNVQGFINRGGRENDKNRQWWLLHPAMHAYVAVHILLSLLN